MQACRQLQQEYRLVLLWAEKYIRGSALTSGQAKTIGLDGGLDLPVGVPIRAVRSLRSQLSGHIATV